MGCSTRVRCVIATSSSVPPTDGASANECTPPNGCGRVRHTCSTQAGSDGSVQLDIFCELERAEPKWSREGEAGLIADSLAQAKLADDLGYGCWWTVEHHGCGEFSLSSTPELLNGLVSQHPSAIR